MNIDPEKLIDYLDNRVEELTQRAIDPEASETIQLWSVIRADELTRLIRHLGLK